jgi:PKD repeat protein
MADGRSNPSKHLRWGMLLALPLLALAALVLATHAQADPGLGGAAFTTRGVLEGEHYDTPWTTSGCDPSSDGEHTKPEVAMGWSRDGRAFIPNTNCGILYRNLNFPVAGQFNRVFVAASGSLGSLTYKLDFYVDGTLKQSKTFPILATWGLTEILIDPGAITTAGVHDLRIHYTVTGGAGWHNLFIDCVKFAETDPLPCKIPKPLANFDWVPKPPCHNEPAYFTDLSSVVDPSIPFVRTRWDFGDGTVFGPAPWTSAVTHTYRAPGTYLVNLTVWDSNGDVAYKEKTVTICNTPPVLATRDQWVIAGNTLISGITAYDPNGDAVTLAIDPTTIPAGMLFDTSSMRYAWATEKKDLGDHPIKVTITDVWGASATGTFTIHVLPRGAVPPSPDDKDGDSIPDYLDDCTVIFDGAQTDSDGDGLGDACLVGEAGGFDEAGQAPVIGRGSAAQPRASAASAALLGTSGADCVAADPRPRELSGHRVGERVVLSWVGASDCIADRYAIFRGEQLVGVAPMWSDVGRYEMAADSPAAAHTFYVQPMSPLEANELVPERAGAVAIAALAQPAVPESPLEFLPAASAVAQDAPASSSASATLPAVGIGALALLAVAALVIGAVAIRRK